MGMQALENKGMSVYKNAALISEVHLKLMSLECHEHRISQMLVARAGKASDIYRFVSQGNTSI